MNGVSEGDRVEFEGFGEPDPYSNLTPGTRGTVTLVDDVGTVHVRWDNGSNLGMVTRRPPWQTSGSFRPDRFRKVES